MRRRSACFVLIHTMLVLASASLVAQPVATSLSLAARADGLIEVRGHDPTTTVRYTLDGTEPGKDAGAWLAPVQVPPGYQLKARAFTRDDEPAGETASLDGPPLGDRARTPSTAVPITQNRDWRVYDWAERHAAASALMETRRPEIVMLGDSITHFWGGEPTGGRTTGRNTAPAQWDRVFAGRRVVNLGYGWDRTENVLWRLTHGEFDDVTPAVVVILIGTNNVPRNTPVEVAAGVEAICTEIHRRSPSTRQLVLGLLPRGERPNEVRTAVADVNRRLAALDGRLGVTFLDISAVFLSPDGAISRDVMYDFLHPTAHGYQLWWDAMAPTLERLLKPVA